MTPFKAGSPLLVNFSTSSILKVIPSHSSLCNSCGLHSREALTGPCGSKARTEQSSNVEQARAQDQERGEVEDIWLLRNSVANSRCSKWDCPPPVDLISSSIVMSIQALRFETIGLQLILLSCPAAVQLSSHSMYACFASVF